VVTVAARLGRAQAIQAASRAEFDQLKHQIVTVLGHELRTPLTYVTGYTGMALENVPELSPEQLSNFLLRIKSGTDRLTHLVEDLLSLIQLDTGEAAQDFALLAAVSQNLEVIVARAVQGFEEEAVASGLVLDTELDSPLPPVRLSESLFLDALGRLLDNGIKFSRDKGERVKVSARATDNWVEVAVSDQGVGISPQEMPNLFQRFRQIDRKRLEQQGVGLGLSIARELIRLHGGDIEVESALGEGSTFTIRLPFAKDGAEYEVFS
jgi:signal transduction histidine kinase